MRHTPLKRVALALGATLTIFGQVQGPMLGYLPDAGSLRPIRGIPSAGAIGNPLAVDRAFSLVSLLAAQNAALARDVATGEMVTLTVDRNFAVTATVIESLGMEAPDRIDASPGGATAIVTRFSTARIRVITGLPSAPVIAREIDTGFLGTVPFALAVSDDGEWVAGLWPSGAYAFGPQNGVVKLYDGTNASAVAFFHGSHDLVSASDRGVTRITDIGGTALITVLDTAPQDTPPPLALGITPDNARVLVIYRSGTLRNINLSVGAVTATLCECAPADLHPLGDMLFRLTGLENGSIKIYDAASGNVWFAPLALLRENGDAFRKGGPAGDRQADLPRRAVTPPAEEARQ